MQLQIAAKPPVLCCHLTNPNEELGERDRAISPFAKLLWSLCFAVLTETWRVVHTDYHYALVYVCSRSTAATAATAAAAADDDDDVYTSCSYETMLVLARPSAMTLNSEELAEYFQLTLEPYCLTVATELDVVTDTGNFYY